MCRKSCCQIVLVLAAIAVPAVAADDTDDKQALQGTWKPNEAVLGDNKIDMMLLEMAALVIEGDQYTITIRDKMEKGTLSVDPKKMPKTMDIFPTQGDNNGKTFLAIYKVEGDSLIVCYSLDQVSRPEDFEPDSNTLLVVKYQRMKAQ
jgi:uncharacterized protein (TIGR03067 family)